MVFISMLVQQFAVAVTLVLNVVSVFKVKVLGDYSFVMYVYLAPHEMAHSFIWHQIIYCGHKYLRKCIIIPIWTMPDERSSHRVVV